MKCTRVYWGQRVALTRDETASSATVYRPRTVQLSESQIVDDLSGLPKMLSNKGHAHQMQNKDKVDEFRQALGCLLFWVLWRLT